MICNVLVDSEVLVVISSISSIYRLNLLKVLIGVGLRACVPRNEYVCMYVKSV